MGTYKDIIENRVNLLLAVPKWLFNISLCIGTIVFLLTLLPGTLKFMFVIGSCYIGIAVVINACVFLGLIFSSFAYSHHQKNILMSACILLGNIPIALLYMWILSSSL
jgi:hypothetical protein